MLQSVLKIRISWIRKILTSWIRIPIRKNIRIRIHFFSEDPGSGFGAASKLNGSEALSTEKTKKNLK